MPAPDPYSCPNCQARLAAGLERCPGCGMLLRGAQAVRLWQVQQQIAALTDESQALIADLLHPSARAPVAATGAAAVPPPGVARPPERSLSAQQILLGLGALLLLSAAAAFLVVVWRVVGLAGQAAIMACLTAAAAAGAAVATRRSLPAAAETAAVLATGLVLVDLTAAHGLDLAGLGRVPLDRYWACASALAGALVVLFDLCVPRERAGTPLRRIVTYRPAASLLFAAATWLALLAAGAEGAWLVGGLMLVAGVDLAGGLLAARLDRTSPAGSPVPPTAGSGSWSLPMARRLPVSALILLGSGALAVVGHVVAGLRVGYAPGPAVADRYAAFALLMVAPVLLAACSTRSGARLLPALEPVRHRLPVVAVAWAGPVLVIPVLDAGSTVLVAVAVLLAGALTCVWLGLVTATAPVRAAWLRVLTVAGSVAQPLLAVAMVLLAATQQATLREVARNAAGHASVPVPLVVLTAVAWAVPSATATVRRREARWAWVTEAAVLLALVRSVAGAGAAAQVVVMLLAFAANAALAAVAAHRAVAPPAATEDDAGTAGAPDRSESPAPDTRTFPFWSGVEVAGVLFGAVYAAAASLAALDLSAGYLSLTLFVVGVLTIGYAAAPQRLAFAYLGSLVISAGTANLLSNAHVHLVEAYTAPLAVLLAGTGAVQWLRDRSRPTLLVAGPALTVALGPSLVVALRDGDAVRLAGVTAVAVAVLVVGLARRWKAPVTVGTLVLVVVGVTQGGPLVGYLPGWLTLALGAAALLAVGVLWEQAVVAGRRANAWFGTLT